MIIANRFLRISFEWCKNMVNKFYSDFSYLLREAEKYHMWRRIGRGSEETVGIFFPKDHYESWSDFLYLHYHKPWACLKISQRSSTLPMMTWNSINLDYCEFLTSKYSSTLFSWTLQLTIKIESFCLGRNANTTKPKIFWSLVEISRRKKHRKRRKKKNKI